MIKKILLLVLLAAFVAVATEALSQNPASQNSASQSPPVTSKTPSTPEKSLPATSPAPAKTAELPAAGGKEATGGKSSSSKSFPTSSAFATSSPAATTDRKELVVERALVTLFRDNKVPAAEAGMLTDVSVEEGQSVEKDDVVAQIDSRSTVARRRIAEGELAAAKAQASNDAEIDVAIKAEEVSRASLDQIDDIRAKNPNAVSLFERRKTYFEHEKAKSQIEQATNEKEIAGLTAQAKQAQLDAASIELDLRQARAPFNGQVVEVMKKPGDWVTAGEPIMHIVGLDRLRVKGFVSIGGPNGASHDEVLGKPVTITVSSSGDKKHTVKGIIGFASPVIEGVGASRQFRVWANIDNEKAIDPVTKLETWKIQPGSTASMTIDLMPAAPAKGKGTVNAYKPVTGSDGKSNTKKAPRVR